MDKWRLSCRGDPLEGVQRNSRQCTLDSTKKTLTIVYKRGKCCLLWVNKIQWLQGYNGDTLQDPPGVEGLSWCWQAHGQAPVSVCQANTRLEGAEGASH